MNEAARQKIRDRIYIGFGNLTTPNLLSGHFRLPISLKVQSRHKTSCYLIYILLACNSRGGETSMSVGLTIRTIMNQIARDHNVNLPPLNDDLTLHESGFDSLCFAILVARLEDEVGIDPFTMSDDVHFPVTLGDFIRAYENVPA
jgi:hypothetical protein